MCKRKVVEQIKTHILCSATFFFPPRESCCLSDNVKEYGTAGQATDDNIIGRIGKNRDTVYIILVAVPLQQWLRERASKLRCTYVGRSSCTVS